MLDPAGPQAQRITDLWWVFFAVVATVYVAVMLALVVALARGRRARESDPAALAPVSPATSRRSGIAIGASSLATTVVLLVLLVASVRTSGALARAERDAALPISIEGQQWWWSVRYTDGPEQDWFETANEIHIPVGRSIRLQLGSADVIHSFWVPALHGKKDLIPGRATELYLRADRPGTYRGWCAEFCGHQHANMLLTVVAESEPEFEAWRARQRAPGREPQSDAERRGQQVFLKGSCALCHTIRGTSAGGRLGPDLTHLASRQRIAANVLPNTRGHLAGWIVDAQSVKPFSRMPPSLLSGPDLQALLDYMRSLE